MGFILESELDHSVNFVKEIGEGKIESRYVRRNEEKVNCYLSSQTGCRQACRMCFLTQTGQTNARNVTPDEYYEQAWSVLEHYVNKAEPAYRVNYCFMARGDVFANDFVLTYGRDILLKLGEIARDYSLLPLFKLSTIMPSGMLENVDLFSVFGEVTPDIYYSLYSVDPEFRKRWLPKSMPVARALAVLRKYQERSNKIITIHWAFIEGQNDSKESVCDMAEAIDAAGIRPNFNIVRYNPFSEKFGKESDIETIKMRLDDLQSYFPAARVKVIDRIGFDVQASCGMFVS